jgi:hypothetical protein
MGQSRYLADGLNGRGNPLEVVQLDAFVLGVNVPVLLVEILDL